MRVKDGYLLDMAARPCVFDVVGVKATALKLSDTQLGSYFAFNLSVDVVLTVHDEHGMPPSRASVAAEALLIAASASSMSTRAHCRVSVKSPCV
jgi:hypothetical protein